MKNLLCAITLTALICGCSQSTDEANQTSDTAELTQASEMTEQAMEAFEVKHVDAEQAAALLNDNSEVVVLDVRTPSEYQSGHIADAKLIDFRAADFEEQLAMMDRDQPYLVHCQSGGRSGNSLAIFEKLGFKNVYHLDGGYSGWVNAGNETVE